jgi:hypothetical protein
MPFHVTSLRGPDPNSVILSEFASANESKDLHSMPEVPYPCKDHRQAQFVGRRNHVFITH